MEEVAKKKIGMLLDIDNLSGEHSGRLTPWILVLVIGGAPVLFYVYFSWFLFFPVWAFTVLEVILVIRLIMIFPGRESYRKQVFKKQLLDEYTSIASMMNVKTIHPDGCIEYTNGRIIYLVCCFNGTVEDTERRTIQLRKLLENMFGDYEFDTYINNVIESPVLSEYYERVKTFGRNEAATNFMRIIDHTIELTEDTSMVQCTMYALKGHRSDWKNMKLQIDTAIKSRAARCYKSITCVTDIDIISSILNRDIDGIINIDELTRKKYATQQYESSKVIAYDLPEDKEVLQGFEAVTPVIPKQSKQSFHTSFEDEALTVPIYEEVEREILEDEGLD